MKLDRRSERNVPVRVPPLLLAPFIGPRAAPPRGRRSCPGKGSKPNCALSCGPGCILAGPFARTDPRTCRSARAARGRPRARAPTRARRTGLTSRDRSPFIGDARVVSRGTVDLLSAARVSRRRVGRSAARCPPRRALLVARAAPASRSSSRPCAARLRAASDSVAARAWRGGEGASFSSASLHRSTRCPPVLRQNRRYRLTARAATSARRVCGPRGARRVDRSNRRTATPPRPRASRKRARPRGPPHGSHTRTSRSKCSYAVGRRHSTQAVRVFSRNAA